MGSLRVGWAERRGEGIPGQNCTRKQREVEMSKAATSVLFRGNCGIQLALPGRDEQFPALPYQIEFSLGPCTAQIISYCFFSDFIF